MCLILTEGTREVTTEVSNHGHLKTRQVQQKDAFVVGLANSECVRLRISAVKLHFLPNEACQQAQTISRRGRFSLWLAYHAFLSMVALVSWPIQRKFFVAFSCTRWYYVFGNNKSVLLLFLFFREQQSQSGQLPLMLCAGFHNVDPSGVDVGMAQHIRQLCNVLFRRIKYHGKQVAQIVRKHLAGIYIRRAAQPFHFPPDVGSVYRFSTAGLKDRTGDSFVVFGPPQKLAAQLAGNQNNPAFPLTVHQRLPSLR